MFFCCFLLDLSVVYLCLFFFFKQKTAYEMRISDWSSDVCSSDLDEEEISEDDREPEHDAGLPGRRLLLERGAGPLEGVARRQGRRRQPLHRRERRATAVAWGRSAVDDCRVVVVIAGERLRPENQARLGKSPNRHHLALVVLHVDPIDVVDLRAVVGLGLDVDLPGPAEEIEVVHVIAAERGLQRGNDVINLPRSEERRVGEECVRKCKY